MFAMAMENFGDLTVLDSRFAKLLVIAGAATEAGKVIHTRETSAQEGGDAISCDAITFMWGEGLPKALDNVSIKVRRGELLVVTGMVGSGKSTLLLAILGELLPSAGHVKVCAKSVGYVSQDPFILQASVLDNITAGCTGDVDMRAVSDAVLASGFSTDLDRMADGLDELVGERGVTMSGGQKARLALARVLYARQTDVVILDDPLSALDAVVQQHVFIEAILKMLLGRGCTVVLATHQTHLLDNPHLAPLVSRTQLCVLDGGAVKVCGPAAKVAESAGVTIVDAGEGPSDDVKDNDYDADEPGGMRMRRGSCGSRASEEAREIGKVSRTVYKHYMVAGFGIIGAIWLVVVICLHQCATIGAMLFVTNWAEMDKDAQDDDGARTPCIYAALIVGSLVFAICSEFSSFFLALRASRKLHDQAFRATLKTHLSFFETNPVGRIMNRFSRDMGMMDDQLPMLVANISQMLGRLVSIIVLVCVLNPVVLLVLPPLALILSHIQRFYLRTAPEVKRIDGTTRSPIFAHFTTLLDGLPTLRAFGMQHVAHANFCEANDLNFAALSTYKAIERWYGLRMDGIAVAVQLAAVCGTVGFRNILNSTLLVLSLPYAMQLGTIFQFTMRMRAEAENAMTGVERVLAYASLPPEEENQKAPVRRSQIKVTDSEWPELGLLEFRSVTMHYALAPVETPPALYRVSFAVKPGEGCGVVGRTGSGKSSLLAALFRMNPISAGAVIVHGRDSMTVQMMALRSAIGVIPQTPAIFSGSVAFNLNPCNTARGSDGKQVTQEELWAVLKEVRLEAAIRALPDGLKSELGEEANSLSAGERQCLCLARVLRQRQQILVLDEATTNCDADTDAKVQDALRGRQGKFTTLAIAHRLETVLGLDKILVLSDGKVAQFGPPDELMRDKDGLLVQLAETRRGSLSSVDDRDAAKATAAAAAAKATEPTDALEPTRLTDDV
eukprot:NODE_172_length_3470_cov_2.749925.p1 GENE.NODE_172_length_3470_cov_2.749925~~NODE_172_length_3470_cov_2.749925.p1  ORF type:complete len:955 (+),score=307.05 NODE_172_length_3470_cov_2.749925:276-3140(+)